MSRYHNNNDRYSYNSGSYNSENNNENWREELEKLEELNREKAGQKKQFRQMVIPPSVNGVSLKNQIQQKAFEFYGNPNRLEALAKKNYPNMNLSDAIQKLLEEDAYTVEGVGESTAKNTYNQGVMPTLTENIVEINKVIKELKEYWKNVNEGKINRNRDYEEYLYSYLEKTNNNNASTGGYRTSRRTRRAQRKTKRRRAQRKTRARRS